MLSSSDGVAAANLAAADWLPFLPHSYELTPHWRRKRGTCMAMLTMLVSAVVFDSQWKALEKGGYQCWMSRRGRREKETERKGSPKAKEHV